jgi:RNA polymerase sigma-70 factor (ECF subfamily)
MLALLQRRTEAAASDAGDFVAGLRGAVAEPTKLREAEAERALLVALGPALLRTVRSVLGYGHPETEDALQEVMIAVHEALPGFRGECKMQHFACRVAFQTTMNIRRRARYRSHFTPASPPDEVAALMCDKETPERALAAARRREVLRRALGDLPRAQSETLGLHAILGYSVDETAAAMGVPRDTVRSRLRSARAGLRARFQGSEDLLDSLGGDS